MTNRASHSFLETRFRLITIALLLLCGTGYAQKRLYRIHSDDTARTVSIPVYNDYYYTVVDTVRLSTEDFFKKYKTEKKQLKQTQWNTDDSISFFRLNEERREGFLLAFDDSTVRFVPNRRSPHHHTDTIPLHKIIRISRKTVASEVLSVADATFGLVGLLGIGFGAIGVAASPFVGVINDWEKAEDVLIDSGALLAGGFASLGLAAILENKVRLGPAHIRLVTR